MTLFCNQVESIKYILCTQFYEIYAHICISFRNIEVDYVSLVCLCRKKNEMWYVNALSLRVEWLIPQLTNGDINNN